MKIRIALMLTLCLSSCALEQAAEQNEESSQNFDWKAPALGECHAEVLPSFSEGVWYLYAPPGAVVEFNTDLESLSKTTRFNDDAPKPIAQIVVGAAGGPPHVYQCRLYPLKVDKAPS